MTGDERTPHTERATLPEDPAAVRRRRRELSRRDFLRLSALATGVFGAPAFLAACGANAPAAPQGDAAPTSVPAAAGPQRGGTLVLASYDADTLDPHTTQQVSTGAPLSLVLDTLVVLTPTGTFEGRLAESWEISDDNLTVTFTLRDGVMFHDGTPFDAAAVKASFDRYAEIEYSGVIDRIEVIDPLTVRFILLDVYAPFLADLNEPWSGIISPTAVEQLGDDFGRAPVGTGPYKVKEWIPGEQIVLERYEEYQEFRSFIANKGPAYFDEVIFRAIAEDQTVISSLETGEIHVANYGRGDLGPVADSASFTFLENPQGISVMGIWFTTLRNPDGSVSFKPPFDDVRVRQAIGHALNNEDIVAISGGALVNRTPVPVGGPTYSTEIAEQYGFQFDPERANQLLDEAGWTLGADGVRVKDGQRLDLALYTNNSTERQRISELVQNQLTQVGIASNIQAIELGSFLASLEEGLADITLLNSTNPDPDMLYSMTDSEESGLYSYQEYNPAFADLVTRARLTYDMAERVPLYHEAQRLFMADPLFIPLLTYTGALTVRPEVQGVAIGYRNLPILQDASFVA